MSKEANFDFSLELWKACEAGYAAGLKDAMKWISVKDELPDEFVSVLAHMTDAEEFPVVREAYVVCGRFFFPALRENHPVDYWMEMPEMECDRKRWADKICRVNGAPCNECIAGAPCAREATTDDRRTD